MKNIDYVTLTENSNRELWCFVLGLLFVFLLVFLFFVLSRIGMETKKIERKRHNFRFFHKDKPYLFGDALVLLKTTGELHNYFLKFPDNSYFNIEFSSGCYIPDIINKLKTKQMIEALKLRVGAYPKEVFAALELLK
jgi:hypothetical protein